MHSELATRYDLILSCISSPFATAKAGDDFPFHNLNEIFYRVPNNGEKFSKILRKTKTQLNLKQLSLRIPNNNQRSEERRVGKERTEGEAAEEMKAERSEQRE